jgi:adenylate cyclase
MLREMNEGLEVLTAQTPFVLVLEDLQWSDPSTLALIAVLARRQAHARLLVLGTYRPEEGLAEGRPLRGLMQELRGHGQCHDLGVSLLEKADVEGYLAKRFPASVLPERLAPVLYQLTEGNPLFLVTLVNDWVDRTILLQTEGIWTLQKDLDALTANVPDNLRHLLSKQSDRLTQREQSLLEVGSVAGLEFSAATVAAAATVEVVEVERSCQGLADRQLFLRPAGISEWPDGTVAACYGFRHALYQYLWNERVTPSQRQRLHQQIGERLESAYEERVGEIAAELAVHFEQGRDYQRTLRYLQQAAQNALQRSAPQEAVGLLTKGLELLKTQPDTPARAQQELNLQVMLGPTWIVTKGYAALEVERAYARAQSLSRQIGQSPQLFPVLFGLWVFHLVRGKHETAYELGKQCMRLAQSVQDPMLLLQAHHALGVSLSNRGEFAACRAHFERELALYNPQRHRAVAAYYGQDPGVACLSHMAWSLWFLGYPEQALKRIDEAFTLAQELCHANSLAAALNFAAYVHQLRKEGGATQQRAEALITLCTEQEIPFWLAWGIILRGWALAEQDQGKEGLAQLQQGLDTYWALGAEQQRPYFLALLAEVQGRVKQEEKGLTLLSEALAAVQKNGECWWEAELYRLKGELTLQQSSIQRLASGAQKSSKLKVQGAKSRSDNLQSAPCNPQSEAEMCFHKAIEIARRQGAKSLELRAATSLARLLREQGNKAEAQRLLEEVYGWFTEGFGTPDLQEAKALLEELT